MRAILTNPYTKKEDVLNLGPGQEESCALLGLPERQAYEKMEPKLYEYLDSFFSDPSKISKFGERRVLAIYRLGNKVIQRGLCSLLRIQYKYKAEIQKNELLPFFFGLHSMNLKGLLFLADNYPLQWSEMDFRKEENEEIFEDSILLFYLLEEQNPAVNLLDRMKGETRPLDFIFREEIKKWKDSAKPIDSDSSEVMESYKTRKLKESTMVIFTQEDKKRLYLEVYEKIAIHWRYLVDRPLQPLKFDFDIR